MKSFKKCSSEAPVISCKLTSVSSISCWIIQMAKFYNGFSYKYFFFHLKFFYNLFLVRSSLAFQ